MRPVQVWILALLYHSHILDLSDALPEDWKPKQIRQLLETSPVFIGDGPKGKYRLQDLQEVKLIKNEYAVITARNNIFVLQLADLDDGDINYNQVVNWMPTNSTFCDHNPSEISKCSNFIRINAKMSGNRFLMCGTNARSPKCREYEWDGRRFLNHFVEGDDCSHLKTCLIDDVPSLAYLFTDGNLYLATKLGHRRHSTVRRTPLSEKIPEVEVTSRTSTGTTVNRDETLPILATEDNEDTILNEPVFVSAIESNEKVFVFFREKALEQFGNGEVLFSRVAQVCKNDRGGTDALLRGKWTSYFKARLNCSVAGGKPFNFNELQHVTRPFVINGVTTIFAVMTTPANSIWGSAICAYTVRAIEETMAGKFRPRNSMCGSKRPESAPVDDPHPTTCLSEDDDTSKMGEDALRFRKQHPLMFASVQPITDQPLFMRTQARYQFSAIEVEIVKVAIAEQEQNVTLFYIGTTDGHLLKVVPRPFNISDKYDASKLRDDGAFIEEIKVYDKERCTDRPTGRSVIPDSETSDPMKELDRKRNPENVMSITVVEGKNTLLVAFQNCIISVPKQDCAKIRCRKACIQSGNPYCGWMDNSCIAVDDDTRPHIEQDIFSERQDLPDCPGETTMASGPYVQSQCPPGISLAAPIAISLATSFVLVLAIFFIVMKCRKGSCTRRKKPPLRQSTLQRDNSYARSDASWDENNRRPIYRGPTSGSLASLGSAAGRFGLSDTTEPATTEGPPPYGNTMDSINGLVSRSSSGSVLSSNRGAEHEETSPPVLYSNLNNNNFKRNVGIAYALSRNETPVRRRSINSNDNTQGNNTRLGLTWGTSAGGTPQRQPPCWKPNNFTGENVMPVLPMPISSLLSPPQHSHGEVNVESSNQIPETPARARRSEGVLPQIPASGLTSSIPAKSPKIVSSGSEVENFENRTFRRHMSANEPDYSEHAEEPEYENLKFQRKGSTPGDFLAGPPSVPPSANAKPGRKFSSFTTSHFNTSWFRPPALLEDIHNYTNPNEGQNEGDNCGDSTASGGVSSASSISVPESQQNPELGRLEPGRMETKVGLKNRPSIRSTDEGYSSELFSNEGKRSGSSGSDGISNSYNHISQEDLPFFNGQSPDGEIAIPGLNDSIDSTSRTLKKKKSSKKKKKQDKKSLVPDLSSPSDSENVFREGTYTLGRKYSNKMRTEDEFSLWSSRRQARDDSFVDCSTYGIIDARGNESCNYGPNQYAFHTMRPPGRMRQKLPRLRNGPKDSDATLIAVPTPEIPKV